MSEPVSALNGASFDGLAHVEECGLQGMITLREPSPGVAGEFGLDVSYGETVVSVELQDDDLVVTTHRQCYRSRAVPVALRDDLDPSLLGPLADIVVKAMAVEPDERWSTAEAMTSASSGSASMASSSSTPHERLAP